MAELASHNPNTKPASWISPKMPPPPRPVAVSSQRRRCHRAGCAVANAIASDMPRGGGGDMTIAPQTTITVKQGDVFQWPGSPGTSFKVIDLRPEQAVAQQVETKKMFTIPRQ